MWTEEIVNDQKRDLPLFVSTEKCSGGSYIVTGANSGLGLEAAKHLLQVGAKKVVLAVRNVKAGEDVKKDLEAATGTSGVAEVWQLDLASYDSIKAFAKKAVEELERIDALIQNAGVALDKWVLAEGHESSVTINIFGTMLLSVLLFPKMSEDAKKFGITPHQTIITSGGSFRAQPFFEKIKDEPFPKLDDENGIGMMGRYPLSKLVGLFGARYFATLVPVSRTGVVVNLVDPGLCYTNLTSNVSPELRDRIHEERKLYGRTAEMGSRTLLHGAVAGVESHGKYLSACEIKEHLVPEWVTDEDGVATQKRVWEGIAKELERVEPGCTTKIL